MNSPSCARAPKQTLTPLLLLSRLNRPWVFDYTQGMRPVRELSPTFAPHRGERRPVAPPPSCGRLRGHRVDSGGWQMGGPVRVPPDSARRGGQRLLLLLFAPSLRSTRIGQAAASQEREGRKEGWRERERERERANVGRWRERERERASEIEIARARERERERKIERPVQTQDSHQTSVGHRRLYRSTACPRAF